MPLHQTAIAIRRGGDGSYGILSDTAPLAWGANLTLKLRRDSNQHVPQNAVEWFLSSQLLGSGCLGFSNDMEVPPQLTVAVQASRSLTAKVLRGIDAYTLDPNAKFDFETERAIVPGCSLGGMRPKTLVMHEGSEHIAKFSRPDDLIDVPTTEYATLRLATRAGLDVPSFELVTIGERSVLLIERFDRKDGGHIHYASAQSFLDPQPLSSDGREFATNFSYAGIAEALRPFNANVRADAHELYRRMVLNIMVGNVDDHLRNHAFLMVQPSVFRLSPAFDIVPHLEAPHRPQSIGVGKFGPASTIANALSQCDRFLLTEAEAREIVGEIKDIASTWRNEFREAGISQRDINLLSDCFGVADQAERLQISASVAAVGTAATDDEKIQIRCNELGLSLKRARQFVEAARNQVSLAAILSLDETTLAPLSPRLWLQMAAQGSSVSYRLALNAEQLRQTLISGHVDEQYAPHLSTLFDEVPCQVSIMAIFQAANDEGIPMKAIWRNVEQLASNVGALRLNLWKCESESSNREPSMSRKPKAKQDPLAAARGRGDTYMQLELASVDNLTLSEAAKRTGFSETLINMLRERGELYALIDPSQVGGFRFPAWQFECHKERLLTILDALHTAGVKGWGIHAFMNNASRELLGRSPRDYILESGAPLEKLMRIIERRYVGEQGAQ